MRGCTLLRVITQVLIERVLETTTTVTTSFGDCILNAPAGMYRLVELHKESLQKDREKLKEVQTFRKSSSPSR